MANYATSALKLSDTYVNTLPYNTCSTAEGTAAKTVNAGTFALETGAMVVVKFTKTNTAANPTLNVSSTGAKAIYYNGAAITAGYLKANKVYQFIYNGTRWDLVGDVDTNTTYTIPTVNNAKITISAGSGLTDGGDFTVNQSSAETITLNVGAGTGISVAADSVSAKLRSTTALTVNSAAATTTSGRVYPVAVDKEGYLSVNVPWTNTNTAYLPKAGGTMTGNITMDNSASAQSGEPYFQWATIGSNKPYTGFAHDQSDGTFIICSMEKDTTTHGVKYYKNGLSIGGGSGNLFWKGVRVATVDDIPGDTYHTPLFTSGLKIGTGIGVADLYVPTAGAQALGTVRGFHRTSGTATGTKTTNASNAPAINNRTTTASRYYGVETDASGYMFVNVPWTNTTYTFNGAVSTIKDSNLTVNRALISNSSGKVAVSAVTSTELGYLDGVTSNVQTQLNNKAPAYTYGTTGLTAGSSSLAAGTLYFQYE